MTKLKVLRSKRRQTMNRIKIHNKLILNVILSPALFLACQVSGGETWWTTYFKQALTCTRGMTAV